MTNATPKMDALVDAVYARWQENKSWSLVDVYDTLDRDERLAFHATLFDGQTHNGGMTQWRDNGYGTDDVIGFLQRFCEGSGTEVSTKVQSLLSDFAKASADLDKCSEGEDDCAYEAFLDACDPLDTTYYNIAEAWMAEVEAAL